MKILSNYTHVRYCTDEADLIAGIGEIKTEIKKRIKQEKKIPSYFYTRLKKLEIKLKLKPTEFIYKGHLFEAIRQFEGIENNFYYITRQLTALDFQEWSFDEFWAAADTIEHDTTTLREADFFLMDRKTVIVPCQNYIAEFKE